MKMNSDELANTETIPMVFPFYLKQYYIRKCYSQIYSKIWNHLFTNGHRYVTVTGTPGIGKSVFYMYVFRKLRSKLPDKVFVCATFDKRIFQNAVIFQPGDDQGQTLTKAEFEACSQKYKDSIHLYDAAPTVKPDAMTTTCKMITFTSPNKSWEDSMRKVAHKKYFYVDLWTLDELKRAKSLLPELHEISEHELERRYLVFGGIARYTLCADDFVDEGTRDLNNAIHSIETPQNLLDCVSFRENFNPERISHRLIHFVPQKDDISSFTLEFGSLYIIAKLNERLNNISQSERIDLLKKLDGDSRYSVFRGWLFEGMVHEKLSKGGIFHCRSLRANTSCATTFKITTNQWKPLKTRETLNSVLENMYLKPDITNLAALDSCYFDSENKTLWVFQSSLFLVHPIKHSGLTDIIKIMKLESNCDDTNFIIKFLFIVPANIADLYKKQNIINRSKVPTVERLRDTLDLSGIGQAKKRKLAESGIVSEKDLYKAVSNKEFAKYSSIKKIGDQFKLDVDQQAHTSSVLAKIDSMEQFVMGLDSFKYTELKSTKLGLF